MVLRNQLRENLKGSEGRSFWKRIFFEDCVESGNGGFFVGRFVVPILDVSLMNIIDDATYII